ncbi:MAG: hypothetical protein R3336_03110, partial [Phycisphaeraceae bacterium]|nr:hypothetical protein [Phycisphaeraceae bacterium]
LPQLKGVVAEGNARLAAIEQAIDEAGQDALKADQSRYQEHQREIAFAAKGVGAEPAIERNWEALTTVVKVNSRQGSINGAVPAGEATAWRMKVYEAVSQAPDDWKEPGFDDGGWSMATLPISWHLNHTVLGRSTFNVEDVDSIKALRVSVHPFRQLNIVVYINGKPVAKFNRCENNKSWVHGELMEAAIDHLKKGENTIAFSTTNDWRWATRGTVDNGGFGLKLDMARDQ